MKAHIEGEGESESKIAEKHIRELKREVKIRKYRKLGYEQWARETRYGMRWVATEGIFSAVKRKFGERIVSKNRDSMIAEAIQRFWLYDLLKEYGINRTGIIN